MPVGVNQDSGNWRNCWMDSKRVQSYLKVKKAQHIANQTNPWDETLIISVRPACPQKQKPAINKFRAFENRLLEQRLRGTEPSLTTTILWMRRDRQRGLVIRVRVKAHLCLTAVMTREMDFHGFLKWCFRNLSLADNLHSHFDNRSGQ